MDPWLSGPPTSVTMPAAPDASEQQDAAASADVVQAEPVARDVASRLDDKALVRRKASGQGTMTMDELRSLSSSPAEPAADPQAEAEDALPQQRAPSFDSMPARSDNFISGSAGIASLERQQQQSPEFLLRRVQELIEAGGIYAEMVSRQMRFHAEAVDALRLT